MEPDQINEIISYLKHNLENDKSKFQIPISNGRTRKLSPPCQKYSNTEYVCPVGKLKLFKTSLKIYNDFVITS